MKVCTDHNMEVIKMMTGVQTGVEINPVQSRFVYNMTDKGEIAGVFFFDSNDSGNCFAISHGFRPRWCTKALIMAAYNLAFNELGNKRITALVDAKNIDAIKLNLRLGFKVEGALQDYGSGIGLVMGLLKRNVDFKIFKR